MAGSNLGRLPPELWLETLRYCDMPTLLACRLVNRELHTLASDDSVWPSPDANEPSLTGRSGNWLHKLYLEANLNLVAPRQALKGRPHPKSTQLILRSVSTHDLCRLGAARQLVEQLPGLSATAGGQRVLEDWVTGLNLMRRQASQTQYELAPALARELADASRALAHVHQRRAG